MLVSFCFSQCHVERGKQLRVSIKVSTSFSGPLILASMVLGKQPSSREPAAGRIQLQNPTSPPLARHWGLLLDCFQHCLRPQVLLMTNPVDLGFPSERFAQGFPIAWLQLRLSLPTSSFPFSSHRCHTHILVCGLSLPASAVTEQDTMRPYCNIPWPYPLPASYL